MFSNKFELYKIMLLTLLFIQICNPKESFCEKRPEWIDGTSIFYPAEQYLTGVGTGVNRKLAEDQSYAAISKIFIVEISSHAKDWERYVEVESKDQNRSNLEMNIEQVTKVSTDKVIENVRISEVWFDASSKTYYALATIDRRQATISLKEKISALDSKASHLLSDVRGSSDKLKKLKGLGRTIRMLLLREALNTDLRVIGLTGKGMEESISIVAVKNDLDEILTSSFNISIEVSGTESEVFARSITEGLNQKGFSVLEDNAKGKLVSDLIIRGDVDISEVDLKDPVWKYARWSANLRLVEGSGGKTFGSISRSGREGHLTLAEARNRALKAMQNEIAGEISNKIAEYVFGTD